MNGVGHNLVAHMELHGGVVTKLPVPETVVWSDRGVTRDIVSQIKMHFEITGCSTGKDLVFLIVPWDTDHLIVGWPTLTQEKWLDRMSDLLTIQRAAGVCPVSADCDHSETVEDLNGTVVNTDELLFETDTTPPPEVDMASLIPADNLLTIEEKVELGELLEEHREVFVAKPAGSARVEPMAISYREGSGLSDTYTI